MTPTYAASATLSNQAFSTAANVAEALKSLGFECVRFTGGEPTIFTNLEHLIRIFIETGFRYRLLTNCISLERHYDFITRNPPERFTISSHHVLAPGSVFQVPVTSERLSETRRRLSNIAPLEATIVITEPLASRRMLEESLCLLHLDGVSHVKIVLENSCQQDHAATFREVMRPMIENWSATFKTFRVTDPSQKTCMLSHKGFPAFDLGKHRLMPCCVQASEKGPNTSFHRSIRGTPSEIVETFLELSRSLPSFKWMEYPCSAAIASCPLAITKAQPGNSTLTPGSR